MPCIECQDAAKKVFARGLCQACYYRLRRNGTTQRKYAQNKGLKCLVEGCTEVAVAKGLCTRHYDKLQHPLNATWKLLRSRAGEGQYPTEWNDFQRFLADVGDRPGPNHQLRRHDYIKPHSKENTFWLEPVSAAAKRNWQQEDQAGYMQAWNLKRKFNLEPEQYARMLADQHGVCASCEKAETKLARRTGKVQALAVDHDHETQQVRGLLCFRCNAALGMVGDDLDTLERLFAYLKRHTHEVPG